MQVRRGKRNETDLDMKITVSNFGPVSDGVIRLKPLTIFIGDNNSGKSFTAKLVHSILKSKNKIFIPKNEYEYDFLNKSSSLKLCLLKELEKSMEKNIKKKEFLIPPLIIDRFANGCKIIFREYIEREIIRNFAINPNRLVTIGEASSSIKIDDSFEIKLSKNKGLSVKFRSGFNNSYNIQKISKNNHKRSNNSTIPIPISSENGLTAFNIVDFVEDSVLDQLTQSVIYRPHYFPTSRSWLLHNRRLISANLIRRTPEIDALETIKMPGTVADFVSNLIEIHDKPGHFFHVAEDLETELLRGKLTVTNSPTSNIPKISYRLKGTAIPFHNASSVVTELAPLVLYLKHIVRRDDMLIIEEPEAHLHPENQILLAGHIVRMIREGLKVLLTTHSELLVEHLGRYIQAGVLDESQRKLAKFGASEYLKFDEVSVHLFERTKGAYHSISPIKIDKEIGIDQSSFMDVLRNVHNKHIKLQEFLG